jgi:hypothetical protein
LKGEDSCTTFIKYIATKEYIEDAFEDDKEKEYNNDAADMDYAEFKMQMMIMII